MIGEGMKVRFVPHWNDSKTVTPAERKAAMITGTVVLINWENKVFWIEYGLDGRKQKEAFKFCQIGTEVIVCG